MDLSDRIETGMQTAIRYATANGCPPKLAQALRYAVFPGGARIRPRICLAVALACGDRNPRAANAAATAIELLHCASLVHDDLPCFDNAATRRGKASVHSEFGEAIALLVGDGLIVSAFETVARETAQAPELTARIISTVANAVGAPYGLVAGQAWESEPKINIAAYHRAKTASLFTGAVSSGAIASNGNPLDWYGLADALGAAYQVADDLYDALGETGSMGKPAGQDALFGRPNLVAELGVEGALKELRSLVKQAADQVPDCNGADMLRAIIHTEAQRLMPAKLAASAA
ncbi:geranylgeranyl pyrophosphate synthase [Microvirga tunisiensis]|uniref:Geranylgeranyl pyrophosphate synthase n=2 Tax=Pannonibacter tanglangensis TaxID=2750084 RepID=A0A7X5J7R0_9HYPH|nr:MULTISPECIES: polyprenyl synthetase family protein [unclassified Pannonibacter]NBN63132.1 geranylgeranyl pyrophosphate synthase [Pannonibacter sp. XCT-34]NBN76696.1 geranylgeranyl pyrophosphate synthase [Pannonibacter sp. XCT-53]